MIWPANTPIIDETGRVIARLAKPIEVQGHGLWRWSWFAQQEGLRFVTGPPLDKDDEPRNVGELFEVFRQGDYVVLSFTLSPGSVDPQFAFSGRFFARQDVDWQRKLDALNVLEDDLSMVDPQRLEYLRHKYTALAKEQAEREGIVLKTPASS